MIFGLFKPASQRAAEAVETHVNALKGLDDHGLGSLALYCAYTRLEQLQTELATLVGEINGRHGEVNWIPIRYLNKGYAQSTLAGFYRTARVGLVTSFHDGMNLVAKEYVAAQNPFDPGVLVLSEFAGAAKQLDAALLVNPHDIDSMARAISNGLAMSSAERRERWNAMMAKLEASSLDSWFSDFVAALAICSPGSQASRRPDVEIRYGRSGNVASG